MGDGSPCICEGGSQWVCYLEARLNRVRLSEGCRNIDRSCLSLRNPHARHDDGDTALSRARMRRFCLSDKLRPNATLDGQ